MKGTAKAIIEKLGCVSPRTKEANCAEIYEKIKNLDFSQISQAAKDDLRRTNEGIAAELRAELALIFQEGEL